MWEFFFPNVDKSLLIIPGEDPHIQEEDSDELKVFFIRLDRVSSGILG